MMQYADTGNGGRYKTAQNDLRETRPDGTEFIRFTPVPPYETEPCIRAICENYRRIAEDSSVDSLLVIPVFLHDFLCIHPFDDGNGRMSRLLTLLLLYQAGYMVGRYISVEKHIEKTKDAYYDALEASSVGWHAEKEDPTPFVKYMLGVVLACCREFESRMELIGGTTKSTAYDIVKASVDGKIGKFTKREIADICPSISEKSVEASLRKLVAEGYVKKYGTGKNTFYAKI